MDQRYKEPPKLSSNGKIKEAKMKSAQGPSSLVKGRPVTAGMDKLDRLEDDSPMFEEPDMTFDNKAQLPQLEQIEVETIKPKEVDQSFSQRIEHIITQKILGLTPATLSSVITGMKRELTKVEKSFIYEISHNRPSIASDSMEQDKDDSLD